MTREAREEWPVTVLGHTCVRRHLGMILGRSRPGSKFTDDDLTSIYGQLPWLLMMLPHAPSFITSIFDGHATSCLSCSASWKFIIIRRIISNLGLRLIPRHSTLNVYKTCRVQMACLVKIENPSLDKYDEDDLICFQLRGSTFSWLYSSRRVQSIIMKVYRQRRDASYSVRENLQTQN